MAKWAHADTLDNGIAYIKSNATRMILISAYSAGDSYATVTGNALATVTMASGDYTLSSAGSNRVLTTGTKSATASASSATPNLHVAFTDGSSKVLWVTDETSDHAVYSGDTINFPAITYTTNQPT